MVTQLESRVRDVWGVDDADRQLRRYGAEHFQLALEELRDTDPEGLENPSGLFLRTVLDIAVQDYREKGVNPSLLSKMPGRDQDEPLFVTSPESVPWHPFLGPAFDLNLPQPDLAQIQVSPPAREPLPSLCLV